MGDPTQLPVYVLGRTNDEKGDQLEKLTYVLLAHMGFQNIVTNYKGPGGEEVDLRASYVPPGFSGGGNRNVVCECKAHKTAADMEHWLKFLGKLFAEEKRTGKEADGYFISLSGVNGNVTGHHDGLGAAKDRIRIIAGAELLTQIVRVFAIPRPTNAWRKIAQLDRHPIELALAYYDARFFWLVRFSHGAAAFLATDGSTLNQDVFDAIRPAAEFSFRTDTIIDVHAEEVSIRGARVAQRYILSRLMIYDRPIDRSDLRLPERFSRAKTPQDARAETFGLNEATLTEELAALIRKGWVTETQEQQYVLSSLSVPDTSERLRFILDRFFTDWPGSPGYDRVISTVVPAILDAHRCSELTAAEIELVTSLLRWSPSALKWSLDLT